MIPTNFVSSVLRLEGVAILFAATWAYFARLDGAWYLYVALILAPDVSIAGYVAGNKWGAWVYDLIHNEALAVALVAVGLAAGIGWLTGLELILGAHVGMDRALGFGLKYGSGFRDTHMQRLENT